MSTAASTSAEGRPAALRAPGVLFRRARLLDLDDGTETDADVLVANGVIEDIGAVLHPDTASRVIDLDGRYLVQGLIDLHTHVFDGVADCVNADEVCLARGSTTVVDAGTCGAALIDAFAHFARGYRTRVLAWLNLSTIGLIDVSAGELLVGTYLNPDAALEAARRHPG